MTSKLLALFLVLFSATLLRAQTSTFFVDPATGNNAADGSEGTPFQSLTFAFTQAVAGDNITLRAGTYSGFETFPILLKNGVDVDVFQEEQPVFDGGGSGTLFRVNQNITVATLLRGLVIASCRIGLDIPAGTGVDGLTIQECEFSGFVDSAVGANDGFGIRAVLSSGGTSESLTIDRCSFVGAGAAAGIALEVNGTTVLDGGGILANTSTGGMDRTVWLLATSGGTVAATFQVNDNVFAGYSEAGIFMHALGGGPIFSVASIACQSNGNSLTGSGGLEIGYLLRAQHGVLSQSAVLSPWITYSKITGNYINIFCDAINNGGSVVDILADFYANRIENAVRTGVELAVLVPAGANDNNDPNFGAGHTDRFAGLNTFAGNTTDFRIGGGITSPIQARFNFFPAGGATQIGGVPNSLGILSEVIHGGFTNSVVPDTAVEIQLTAASDSAFVDYAGTSAVGQITVSIDGTQLDQAAIAELSFGAGLTLQLPALALGSKTVLVTNPGGQTGSFLLSVAAADSGSGSATANNCFVATAAYGDYSSQEVVALRRFRDQYLKASPAGRGVIDWYDTHGPSGAAFLLQHESLRKATRVALALPVAVANGTTRWNPGQRFAFGVLLLGAVFGLTRRRV